MNGVIVIDKPQDFTSFDVVAVVRKIIHEKKIGHSGTLDPMATGVLPLLIGKAAKAQSLLPDTDKEYEAHFRLGITTDTLDITGLVLSESRSAVTEEQIEELLPQFRGNIMQVPPMYSAVHHNGARLYDLARKGIEVDREARPVHIGKLELTGFDKGSQEGILSISCSKGTYIRSVCDDIGKALGCGCVMTALRRTKACGFSAEDAVTLDDLRSIADEGKTESIIRSVDSIFSCYPALDISDGQAKRFYNGGALLLERLKGLCSMENGTVYRVYGKFGDKENEFIGLGEIRTETGEMVAMKKFAE